MRNLFFEELVSSFSDRKLKKMANSCSVQIADTKKRDQNRRKPTVSKDVAPECDWRKLSQTESLNE